MSTESREKNVPPEVEEKTGKKGNRIRREEEKGSEEREMRWNSKFIVKGGEADECHLRKHLHMPLPLFFNSLLVPEINHPHFTAVKNGNILEGRLMITKP